MGWRGALWGEKQVVGRGVGPRRWPAMGGHSHPWPLVPKDPSSHRARHGWPRVPRTRHGGPLLAIAGHGWQRLAMGVKIEIGHVGGWGRKPFELHSFYEFGAVPRVLRWANELHNVFDCWRPPSSDFRPLCGCFLAFAQERPELRKLFSFY